MGSLNTSDEPAVAIGGITLGAVTAAILALLGALEAFNLYDVTDTQYMSVAAVIAALWGIIVPMILAIRGIVYAPSSVQDIKEDLAAAETVAPKTATALAQ